MNPKLKKGLNIASWVILILFFLLTLFLILMATTSSKNNGTAKLFGTYLYSVQSDSMEGSEKTSFKEGDLIFVKSVKDATALDVYDVITFRDYSLLDSNGNPQLNTHRIVAVEKTNGVVTSYRTKGDNPLAGIDSGYVLVENVVGVYKGARLPGFGNFTDFLQKPIGFGLIIVLPLGLYFFYRIFVIIKLAVEIKQEKNATVITSDLEVMKAELERLRQQLGGVDGGGSAAAPSVADGETAPVAPEIFPDSEATETVKETITKEEAPADQGDGGQDRDATGQPEAKPAAPQPKKTAGTAAKKTAGPAKKPASATAKKTASKAAKTPTSEPEGNTPAE